MNKEKWVPMLDIFASACFFICYFFMKSGNNTYLILGMACLAIGLAYLDTSKDKDKK